MIRTAVAVCLIATAVPVSAQTAGPVPTQQLTEEIAAADAALFDAFFDRCDIEAIKGMVADDFEMIHDKSGLVAKSAQDFIAGLESTCARQKSGENYRARRELVPGALKVYPINNFGAIEVGEHRFYQLLPGKPEKLVEVALFTHVWKKDPKGWKLARVLSYDHRLTAD
jgi:ketosteroid isomerase-like protein